ncbi:PepSY-associated TM helix domain-containing protein [Ectobacillus ponti]|uniref:PepSY domain-containing protein n=1 Tax=Ectobacillus ponti TaxID=2961894 RepID=A0AA41X5X1_9BACI|nr:PepSY-associated TM helix domain-containing protein [Ectobacillus ponti]MCP8967234.1 PepSY domain-containing protein [Ectobacillus ponti]
MKVKKWMRDAHMYVGLLTSLIVLMLSITGFLMNDHKAAWTPGNEQQSMSGRKPAGGAGGLGIAEAVQKGVESGAYKAEDIRSVFNMGGIYRIATTKNGQFLVGQDGKVTPFAEENKGASQTIKQLHKGFFLGYDIRWLLDIGAVGLVILTGTGVYLYIKMLMMKMKKWTRVKGQAA